MAEAEEMDRRTLEGMEKVLGKEHPNTLTNVSNLALMLQDQGQVRPHPPTIRLQTPTPDSRPTFPACKPTS